MHLKNSHPDTCSVTWELTDRCNFSCWYCPEYLHAGTSSWPDLEKSLHYFRFLAERNSGGVFVDMIGGEPTLWPGLLDFIRALPDSVNCEITTNGRAPRAFPNKLIRAKTWCRLHVLIISMFRYELLMPRLLRILSELSTAT